MSLHDPSPLHLFADKLAARSPLGAAEREAIHALPGLPAQVRTNHDFVRTGEKIGHASLVVDGLVARFGQNRDGNRQITALHVPGDMANLNSVVEPQAGAALQALSVATIVRVPHEALRRLTEAFPRIAAAFWRESVVDAAVLEQWIVNLGRRDALSRMAHLLCEVGCRSHGGRLSDGFRFRFAATQAHMADMLGLTSVHVNRVLRMLREDGLLQIHDRIVEVKDWRRLILTGDFDPAYLALAAEDRPSAGPSISAGTAV